MNKLKIFLLTAALALAGAEAQASFNQADIVNANNAEPNGKNSKDHGFKLGRGKCVFNPSATTGERTIAAHACDLKIPKNSYVTKAYYKVMTTFTSATDAATIAVSITGANDLFTATAISAATDWDAGGLLPMVPTGTMGNEVAVTADSYPTFTVAVEALTAGKLVLWVEWAYYGDS